MTFLYRNIGVFHFYILRWDNWMEINISLNLPREASCLYLIVPFLNLQERKNRRKKIKKWSNKCLEWKLAWNTAVTFTTLNVGDEWKRKLMTKLKPRILEQKQMKVQPSETVRFVSRVTYPADWAETLVDSAVPVTGSRVLVFGWQNFVTSVEVCNKKRGTSCQTRDGH